MAKIERAALLAAINNPFAPRDPTIRMYPVASQANANNVAANIATIMARPSPLVALAVREVVFSPTANIPHYVRMVNGDQIKEILAGTWAADSDGQTLWLRMQATNRADQTGRSTMDSGNTTVGVTRVGAIYRQGTGLIGAVPEPPRHVIRFPWPVVLFGDDTGGLPGLIIQPSAVNTGLRATMYGDEWPLDPDQY